MPQCSTDKVGWSGARGSSRGLREAQDAPVEVFLKAQVGEGRLELQPSRRNLNQKSANLGREMIKADKRERPHVAVIVIISGVAAINLKDKKRPRAERK